MRLALLFCNALKTYLPLFLHDASDLFADTSIPTSCDGHKYLRSVIGSEQFVSSYVKVQIFMALWQQKLHCLFLLKAKQMMLLLFFYSWFDQ